MNAAASHTSPGGVPAPQKPQALPPGAVIAVFAPASPGSDDRVQLGCSELERLGFSLKRPAKQASEGYFAAGIAERLAELLRHLKDGRVDGLVALRGGYGSTYLLEGLLDANVSQPKAIIGFSDLASLQIFLWQRHGWVTFYGPMVAAGLNAGASAPGGYDEQSLLNAVRKTDGGWAIPLNGEPLVTGEAGGRVLGGAMTMIEATFGTPWELDTRDAILLLEDRGMKPYQVDRVLMHFKQAGKLDGVKGIVLGDFPECEPPVAGSPTVRDVCARILEPLGVPVVFGAPIGHTTRPMLTIPLGVNARLRAAGEGALEILEAAVTR